MLNIYNKHRLYQYKPLHRNRDLGNNPHKKTRLRKKIQVKFAKENKHRLNQCPKKA